MTVSPLDRGNSTDYKTNKRKSLRDVQGKITMHLLPFFGDRRKMTSIGTPEIRRFIADRQSEEIDKSGTITKRAAKPAEINRELAALRRSFNLAVQAGRLITCPHFPMLRERNTRRGFLDRDQIDRICAALEVTETAASARSGRASWRTSSHRLADHLRSAAARMAARRLARALRPSRRTYDKERRRPGVPLYG